MKTRKSNLELRYEAYQAVIRGLTLMSDTFMRNVLKKTECAEYILQVIMKDKKLRITEAIVQKDYKNLQGRSAVLDCVAQDENGRIFAVEIQLEREGASPKRARYYSGLLDMNTLNPGESFERLPETYVIFITEDDCLGYGRPIYHMERIIVEVGKRFADQAHIIYVNAGIQDDTELGRLMKDFHCKNADEMHSAILAKRMRELKETQEGVGMMCREMDKIFEEGREEGVMEGKRETAWNLAKMGMPVEQIAEAVKVSVTVVKEWLAFSLL